MEYDDFIKIVKEHHAAVTLYKQNKCICLCGKPRLYHFSLYKKNDSIVIYCDKCISVAKKEKLTELDEKEYFLIRIT